MPQPITEEDLGEGYKRFTLKSANLEAKILNFGGIVQYLHHRNKSGQVDDIVLGCDNHKDYPDMYFGALIGRYANRIAGGKFTLDGKDYQLAINNGPNALHGGIKGFDKYIWSSKIEGTKLVLQLDSPDGDEHYPGDLKVTVLYEVTDDDELTIEYHAETSKPTIINLTNHSYFNLQGQARGNVFDHQVQLACDKYTPVNDVSIPTGAIVDVTNTYYDLRQLTQLTEQKLLENKLGYDHNFVVSGNQGAKNYVGKVTAGGRTMEVYTTQPGVQFYTGFYINTDKGKGGLKYGKFAALCLETQHYPDSPNEPHFPSTVLRPGDKFYEKSYYKFL